MAYLLSYTRLPVDSVIYDPRLAYSMHLAISEDGENYQALNHNSGVLFVKATENEDGSLTPWSLKNPVILELKDGGFGVVAERIGADGEEDTESAGKFLYFTTKDFLDYTEVGFLSKEEAEEKKREGNADRMKVPAAGDVRRTPLRQVITAVADGAVAGMSAVKYLEEVKHLEKEGVIIR